MTDDGFNTGVLYRGNREPYQPLPLADLDSVPPRNGVCDMTEYAVNNRRNSTMLPSFSRRRLPSRWKPPNAMTCWPTRWRCTTIREIAAIFRKMAAIEGEHRNEIARRAGDALVAGSAGQLQLDRPGWPGSHRLR